MRTHLNIIGMDWDEVILILLSHTKPSLLGYVGLKNKILQKKNGISSCLVYHTRLKIIKISLKPIHFEVIYIYI